MAVLVAVILVEAHLAGVLVGVTLEEAHLAAAILAAAPLVAVLVAARLGAAVSWGVVQTLERVSPYGRESPKVRA